MYYYYFGVRCLVLEDGRGIVDEEQDEKDHGEELTGIYPPERRSLDQARIGTAGGPVTVSVAGRQ
jgi:hypothetical protein